MDSIDLISFRAKRSMERAINITISEVLGINVETIDKDTNLTDLDVDDLDLIEIIMQLEADLNIFMVDEAVEGFSTIGDIYKYVHDFKTKMNIINEPKF